MGQLEVPSETNKDCAFCQIVNRTADACIVFQDELSCAFLDRRPVFLGHCLVVPRAHISYFGDLPVPVIGPFFTNVQLLSDAVKRAMAADGTFVAMNNEVSQSVPHVHVHIVPRRYKDGLKGFFWPRQVYTGNEMQSTQRLLISTIEDLRSQRGIEQS